MFGRLFNKGKEKGKDTSNKNQKSWSKDEAEYIFLHGSQTGGTEMLAKSFFKSLIKEGKKVYTEGEHFCDKKTKSIINGNHLDDFDN